MAKANQSPAPGSGSKTRKVKHRSTGAEPFKLDRAGVSFVGRLKDMRIKNLAGKNKEPEPTRLYYFEGEDGKTYFITGKSMLDDQFDELAMKESDGRSVEEGGISALVGSWFEVARHEDTETRAGNTLGNYSLTMYED
jgi:hypothetical protein